MSTTDAFALSYSGLNAFLYAEVGTELNGSTLTMLSVMARLGRDPWAEAARMARLPSAEAIDGLTDSIGRMPLDSAALVGAHATAIRLARLLPSRTGAVMPPGAGLVEAAPHWLPFAVICGAMAIGLALSVLTLQAPIKTAQHTPQYTGAASR